MHLCQGKCLTHKIPPQIPLSRRTNPAQIRAKIMFRSDTQNELCVLSKTFGKHIELEPTYTR